VVTVRVLLVDDDALVRAGLRLILSSADDLEVVGEADDGAQVVTAVREHRPDVVLMDIRMPQMDGITATAALRHLDARPVPDHQVEDGTVRRFTNAELEAEAAAP